MCITLTLQGKPCTGPGGPMGIGPQMMRRLRQYGR